MTRRERLMATLQGEAVDRPPVSFYEIDGSQDTENTDPFNIFNHPSWKPLIELARSKSDCIVRRSLSFKNELPNLATTPMAARPVAALTKTETSFDEAGSILITITIKAGKRLLTMRGKRDKDILTVWKLEHFLKDIDDLKAYLDLPEPVSGGEPDTDAFLKIEKDMGDGGIAMVNIDDPLGYAASLFEMGQFTIVAMTEPVLFHRLVQKCSRWLAPRYEAIARALPGRLWRISGPEFATPPYLPPKLFREYVTEYDKPLVAVIHKYGGFARIHSHGHLKDILDHIAATGCMGLDPIEPPPQGDVELGYVREKYGKQLVLFGNLNISDLETLRTTEFEKKIYQAIKEGTSGSGRGFVLTPTSCPWGRVISKQCLANYEKMVEIIEKL